MTRARALLVVLGLLALVTGCASGPSGNAARVAGPSATASLPSPLPTVSPAVTPTRTAAPAKTRSARPTPVRSTTAAAAPARRRLLVERLDGVGNARQVVAVTATRYGTSYVTLTTYARTGHRWRQVFGPWAARIGYNGFAPSGQKREGDGRTPSGSFGFQFMFGVEANPGVHYSYRPALATSWWDDDPSSPHYNEWVDSRSGDPGRDPEAMRQVPSYRYGAVIGYNSARTPGRGSAIFLHVAHTGATSGCVSLPEPELLAVLRWLDPSQSPRIVMGTTSSVVR